MVGVTLIAEGLAFHIPQGVHLFCHGIFRNGRDIEHPVWEQKNIGETADRLISSPYFDDWLPSLDIFACMMNDL